MSSQRLAPPRPLAGIRILDLSRYAPGPYCSLVCRALGAEVVKVEASPSGDPLRTLDPEAFKRLNAGKKSVLLDLGSQDVKKVFFSLVRGSDVLIEGFRPGTAARLGLDYESVRKHQPRLVYLSISGYGQSGPYRERAGHDINYMALSGALEGARDPLPLQAADFAAGGLTGALAILSALMERRDTGTGRYLDLSMHDALLSLMMLATGAAAERLSGRYPDYGLYWARDGVVLSVGALEQKFWERFVIALGRSDLVERQHDPEARTEIARTIATRDGADWQAIFEELDACVEPVLSFEQALAHPQARHRRPASPSSYRLPFGESLPSVDSEAPRLGEHTREVLLACGLSERV